MRKLCKISFVSWAVKAVQPAGRFCGVFAGASHRLETARRIIRSMRKGADIYD
ncbi:hypothetical protein [uncultured Ruminococcus sp.]|uniref:hypothetical protein n=1 Tax=uncultured Ruminococcus sp. TaxID=165186 RepID=UPI002666CFEE|nr:hypothetical protein [uncultured Ruminococcus sp.]